MALNLRTAPSGNFNLTNWKIGLPIDSAKGFSGTSVEVKKLKSYQHAKYFFTASDGAMTFVAPVEGATTKGSKYARSELREMKGTEKAAWKLSTGGTMSATLEVDHAPTKFSGMPGRLIVGQIHGEDKELVRLYWENGRLYFANEQAGTNNTETKFYFANAAGQQPNVSLNERFSYTISAKGSDLKVSIRADGQTYTSTTKINSVWQKDSFYFKAGTYLGVNETQGTGYGQTSFYALSFNHGGSSKSSFSKALSKTVQGDSSEDILHGKNTFDTISGGYGSDTLYGGKGKDAFVFNTKLGTSETNREVNFDVLKDFSAKDDAIWLDNKVFTKLGKLGSVADPVQLKAAHFANGPKVKHKDDYIVYDQAAGVLSYDADGSGSKAAIAFAQVRSGLALTHKDIFII